MAGKRKYNKKEKRIKNKWVDALKLTRKDVARLRRNG